MFSFLKQLFQKPNDGLAQVLRQGAVIVDVRTRTEYKQGHLAGSKNIPLHEIQLNTAMIRTWNKPVVTVCRSGNRSATAQSLLKAAGIDVYNGGAWTSLKSTKP